MAFNLTVFLTFLYLASNERNVFGFPGVKLAEDGPWVGIGALSDMQSFFESLRNNLDYLQAMPLEEREGLLGKGAFGPEKEASSRSTNSGAYMQALRNQQPSYKIRNFVDSSLRSSNRYDPNLLWTGLGRRR